MPFPTRGTGQPPGRGRQAGPGATVVQSGRNLHFCHSCWLWLWFKYILLLLVDGPCPLFEMLKDSKRREDAKDQCRVAVCVCVCVCLCMCACVCVCWGKPQLWDWRHKNILSGLSRKWRWALVMKGENFAWPLSMLFIGNKQKHCHRLYLRLERTLQPSLSSPTARTGGHTDPPCTPSGQQLTIIQSACSGSF